MRDNTGPILGFCDDHVNLECFFFIIISKYPLRGRDYWFWPSTIQHGVACVLIGSSLPSRFLTFIFALLLYLLFRPQFPFTLKKKKIRRLFFYLKLTFSVFNGLHSLRTSHPCCLDLEGRVFKMQQFNVLSNQFNITALLTLHN